MRMGILALTGVLFTACTDVLYESLPEWLGAENHCEEIFVRCAQ